MTPDTTAMLRTADVSRRGQRTCRVPAIALYAVLQAAALPAMAAFTPTGDDKATALAASDRVGSKTARIARRGETSEFLEPQLKPAADHALLALALAVAACTTRRLVHRKLYTSAASVAAV